MTLNYIKRMLTRYITLKNCTQEQSILLLDFVSTLDNLREQQKDFSETFKEGIIYQKKGLYTDD